MSPSYKDVTLRMFKGAEPVEFTAEIDDEIRCEGQIIANRILRIFAEGQNLLQDGSVSVVLTSGSVSRILTIPVVGNRQGEVGRPGSAGPMLYPAGIWEPRSYYANGQSRPYVYYADDGQYYYLNVDDDGEAVSSDIPGESDKWKLMEKVEVVFAKFAIADYGKMASAVFCGNWMFSQFGKLYYTETDYYIVDTIPNNSSNPDHWSYEEAYDNGYYSAAPFAWFSVYYPQGGHPDTFAPNFAVNMATGDVYGAGGNFVLTQTGDVRLKGTVYARDGEFAGKITANAYFTTPKELPNGTYTIDLEKDPYVFFMNMGTGHNSEVILPSPFDYVGLELQFFYVSGTRISLGYLHLKSNDENILIPSEDSYCSKINIVSSSIATLKSVGTYWLVLSNNVSELTD